MKHICLPPLDTPILSPTMQIADLLHFLKLCGHTKNIITRLVR